MTSRPAGPLGPLGALVLDLKRRMGIVEARPATAEAMMAAVAREAEDRAEAMETMAAAVQDAMDRESRTRAAGDATEAARIVWLSGTLIVPAGLTIGLGRTPRTVAVTGLRKGDRVLANVTDALPAGLALVDATASRDGELTVGLHATAVVTASTSERSYRLAVTVFRPTG